MRSISIAHFHNVRTILGELSKIAEQRGHRLSGWGFSIGGDLGYGVRFIDNRRQLVTFGTRGGRSLALSYYIGQVAGLIDALNVELTDTQAEMFHAAQDAVWTGPKVGKAQNGWADEMDAKFAGLGEIEAFFDRSDYGWAAPMAFEMVPEGTPGAIEIEWV